MLETEEKTESDVFRFLAHILRSSHQNIFSHLLVTNALEIMKHTALVALLLASSATAFAPSSSNGRIDTSLSAKKQTEPKKKTLASRIFDLDLFAPVSDQNDYGARAKKKIVTGKITDTSYVPTGLTKAQYEKIRADEKAKKEANYKAKMAKVCLLVNQGGSNGKHELTFFLCRLVSLKTLLIGTSNEELNLTRAGSRV